MTSRDDPGRRIEPPLVVFDIETTSLGDAGRAVEFAAARLTPQGAVVRQYETLIDPGGPVGGTTVHGLDSQALMGAPRFGDVARDIHDVLVGAVPVAHNLAFDWNVLRREFRRLGIHLPRTVRGICTARLLRAAVGGRGSLDDACAAFDLDRAEPHRASSDVRATVQTLLHLRTHLPGHGRAQTLERFPRAWTLRPSSPAVTRSLGATA